MTEDTAKNPMPRPDPNAPIDTPCIDERVFPNAWEYHWSVMAKNGGVAILPAGQIGPIPDDHPILKLVDSDGNGKQDKEPVDPMDIEVPDDATVTLGDRSNDKKPSLNTQGEFDDGTKPAPKRRRRITNFGGEGDASNVAAAAPYQPPSPRKRHNGVEKVANCEWQCICCGLTNDPGLHRCRVCNERYADI